MQKKKSEFNDVIFMPNLVRQTLMPHAFPAMITSYQKDGTTLYKGFLPGFEFCEVEDLEDEKTCLLYLQDRLDDEVEELVVLGKSLPNVQSDEVLLKENPNYKIAYLDINVYVEQDFCSCSHCEGEHDCKAGCDCESDNNHKKSCKKQLPDHSVENNKHCTCSCCDAEDDCCDDDCNCGGNCGCEDCTCGNK